MEFEHCSLCFIDGTSLTAIPTKVDGWRQKRLFGARMDVITMSFTTNRQVLITSIINLQSIGTVFNRELLSRGNRYCSIIRLYLRWDMAALNVQQRKNQLISYHSMN